MRLPPSSSPLLFSSSTSSSSSVRISIHTTTTFQKMVSHYCAVVVAAAAAAISIVVLFYCCSSCVGFHDAHHVYLAFSLSFWLWFSLVENWLILFSFFSQQHIYTQRERERHVVCWYGTTILAYATAQIPSTPVSFQLYSWLDIFFSHISRLVYLCVFFFWVCKENHHFLDLFF